MTRIREEDEEDWLLCG